MRTFVPRVQFSHAKKTTLDDIAEILAAQGKVLADQGKEIRDLAASVSHVVKHMLTKNDTAELRTRGLTLIELLVVIVIIGILSSVVLASLNGARKKDRDARRISDLKQVQLAMGMYANANQYKYPLALSILAPTYISVLPTDPQGGAYTYAPFLTSSGTTACTSSSVCTTYLLAATRPRLALPGY